MLHAGILDHHTLHQASVNQFAEMFSDELDTKFGALSALPDGDEFPGLHDIQEGL
jgi:hypothetical protein